MDDETQIVTIGSDPDAVGGFGDIYYGDNIIKEGEAFESIGKVVAKKSKRKIDASSDDVSFANLKPVQYKPFQIKRLRDRMKNEAEIALLLHHPSVTTYVGLFVEEGYIGLFVEEGKLTDKLPDLYLVSDKVNSGLARQYLAENRRRDVAEKLVRSDL